MDCIYDLLRPKIVSVGVKLYENGIEKPVTSYDEHRLQILCEAINRLWKAEPGSPYWFETDVFEHRRCFQEKQTTMEVTCYTEGKLDPSAKRKVAILLRYRKKMLDKRHTIHPELFSTIHWPATMEVRFVCVDV